MKTKWLILLLTVCMLFSCTTNPEDGTDVDQAVSQTDETTGEEALQEESLPAVFQNQKHTLRFDENGEFRVLVLGDVQASIPTPTTETLTAIAKVVEREQPDLVLFAGDNSYNCHTEEELRVYLEAMTAYMEENQILWAHVYGNHDEDGGLSKEAQQKVYESFTYCVSQAGPEDLQGVGNYVLPVYSSDPEKTEPVFAVWGMDSGAWMNDAGLMGEGALLSTHMYRGNPTSPYAYMPVSQIKWYYKTSQELETYYGRKIPSLMCFHIPLQEFYEVLLNKNQPSVNFTGEAGEEVGASAINSGMFTALVERGDVKAVVCGHDHLNYFTGEFCDIQLCYSGCISYDTTCNPQINGARVFVVYEDAPEEIETYHSYVYGYNLADLQNGQDLALDFEDESKYSVKGESIAPAAGEGFEGSTGLSVEGKGTVTLEPGVSLGESRYIKMWVDASAGGRLTEMTVESLGKSYTADLTAEKLFVMAEGEEEWTSIKKDSGGLPDGFTGWVATSLGSFKYGESERPAMGSYLFSYTLVTEGKVVVDELVCVANYK